VLMAREKMGSTGIGEGIAIPHIRNPVVLNGSKAIISLCFLEHPIDFNSADGLPVTTLFTIISPAVRVHLQLLSHLGLVLQNPGFKTAIQSKASRENILRALEIAENSSTP
ncbi:MAG TPA: PTS sugar transporter subunit IIA, partial [Chitinispirillaceae bacterium]|nr:PTS sugar transporter subunit IIA [Chitinispirillaceae bacterium]